MFMFVDNFSSLILNDKIGNSSKLLIKERMDYLVLS